MKLAHDPVLLDEAMFFLAPDGRDGVFVDATVGAGGHAAEILRLASPEARLFAFDRDAAALALARKTLHKDEKAGRVKFFHEDFRAMDAVLDAEGVERAAGVLTDLGVSSMQIDDPARGFSFRHDGPLDMRMDARQKTTAADLVNTLPERALADLIFEFGEEPMARRIARAVVGARAKQKIARTLELAEIVEQVKPRRGNGIHPATKTFQALRIAVNRELDGLDTWLDKAAERLRPGARLVVITFHSLEDRMVKHAFRYLEKDCVCPPRRAECMCGKKRTALTLTKRPVEAGEAEMARNPRARSAKLRACERV